MVARNGSALAQTLEETGLRSQFDADLAQLDGQRLEMTAVLFRIIQELETRDRNTWKAIVQAALDAGVTDAEIQNELGTSPSTLHRWKNEDIAPREGTRRLMKGALLALIQNRIDELESTVRQQQPARKSVGAPRRLQPAD